MGLEPKSVEEPLIVENDLGPGWFYLAKNRKDFLKMHPLLIIWDDVARKSDVAVYDRHFRDDNMLQYLRIALWQLSMNQTNVADFVLMLYATLEQKRVREVYEQLSWLSLRGRGEFCIRSANGCCRWEVSKNFYLQRKKVRDAFERFLASDKVGFVLTGQSGVGKSNFVLSLAEEFGDMGSRVCFLMFDGARLNSGALFNNNCRRTFRSLYTFGRR